MNDEGMRKINGYDQEYWNAYYAARKAKDTPSLFAQFACAQMDSGEILLDIGCGNGRDSRFFSKNGILVTALDTSSVAIEAIRASNWSNVQTVCGDITTIYEHIGNCSMDHCYSRFNMHALTEEQQSEALRRIYAILKENGRLWIETRGVLDDIFGKGEPVGRNAFMFDGHYRRFIVLDEILDELLSVGFSIVSAEEKTGFAVYGESDPVVIRIVAQK